MKKGELKSRNVKKTTFWMTLNMAWTLGYTIAIPIAVLGFGGAYADKYFHTSPLFILLGIFIAIAITTVGIYYQIKRIIL